MPHPALYIGPAASPPFADETAGYIDFHSEMHRNAQPVILIDGTSVKWPADYTSELAAVWRKHKGLSKPDAETAVAKRKTLHIRA